MRCGRCGATVTPDAAFCSRCGVSLAGSAGYGSLDARREAALAVFRSGRDASGVQCPNCGGYRMQTIRSDAEENLFWSGMFMLIGIVSLIIVYVGGDTGILGANLSTIALVAILIGVLLFSVARWRRRPSAFECFDCGYRVP